MRDSDSGTQIVMENLSNQNNIIMPFEQCSESDDSVPLSRWPFMMNAGCNFFNFNPMEVQS